MMLCEGLSLIIIPHFLRARLGWIQEQFVKEINQHIIEICIPLQFTVFLYFLIHLVQEFLNHIKIKLHGINSKYISSFGNGSIFFIIVNKKT